MDTKINGLMGIVIWERVGGKGQWNGPRGKGNCVKDSLGPSERSESQKPF